MSEPMIPFTFRLSAETDRKLRKMAADQHITVSALLRLIIRELVGVRDTA